MYFLILDTSSPLLLLALGKEGQIIENRLFAHENRLSQILFSSIEQLLESAKIDKKDLTFVACGVGPGSYTGTRIGAASAQGIAYALQIPLLGFRSDMVQPMDLNTLATYLCQRFLQKDYPSSPSLDLIY